MKNNDTKRRLIIHIGMPKTGTTSIQKFLSVNRLVLEKYDIYIPETGMSGKYHGHHNITWELHDNTPLFKAEFGTLNDLGRELRETNHKTVVISSELFSCFYDNPDKLRKLKDFANSLGMEAYIFVCFREETEYIPLMYEEFLKAGLSMNLNDFINSVIKNGKFYLHFKVDGGWNFCFDYNKLMLGFSDIFGKEFIKVFDYTVPAEITFLKLLGIEDSKEFDFPGRINQPLPSFIVRMLRPYNIIAERFNALNSVRRFMAPIIRNIVKLFVILGLFSKVSSTIKLNSFQRKFIIDKFSSFISKRN